MSAAEKIDDSEFDIEGALTDAVENNGQEDVRMKVVNIDMEPIREMVKEMMQTSLENSKNDDALRKASEQQLDVPPIESQIQIGQALNDDQEVSLPNVGPVDELAIRRSKKQKDSLQHAQETLEQFGEDVEDNGQDSAGEKTASPNEKNGVQNASEESSETQSDEPVPENMAESAPEATEQIQDRQQEPITAVAQNNTREEPKNLTPPPSPPENVAQTPQDTAETPSNKPQKNANAEVPPDQAPAAPEPQGNQKENENQGEQEQKPESEQPKKEGAESPDSQPTDTEKDKKAEEGPEQNASQTTPQNSSQPGENADAGPNGENGTPNGQAQQNDEPYGPEEKNPREQNRAVQMMNQIRFAADIKKLEQQMDAIKEDIKKNYEPKVREVDKELGKMDRKITKLDTVIFSKIVYALAATLIGLVLLIVGIGAAILAHVVQVLISIGKNWAERKKIKMEMKPLRKKRADLVEPIQKKWKEITQLGKQRHRLINRGITQGRPQENQQNAQ